MSVPLIEERVTNIIQVVFIAVRAVFASNRIIDTNGDDMDSRRWALLLECDDNLLGVLFDKELALAGCQQIGPGHNEKCLALSGRV